MKRIQLLIMGAALPLAMSAQSAIDAYRFSQPDLKGTARYMSMGGAFGALGGDLSTISQNPAGIGIYRNSELGFTLDLDCQNSNAESRNYSVKDSQTKFLLNNIGGVMTLRLPSDAVPNLNFGFTYNKAASFNRVYSGMMKLDNSMSNYVAGICNSEGITTADLETTGSYDPYNPTDGGYAAPWIAILGYDGYLTTPAGDPDSPHWFGQWGSNTSGTGRFAVETKGGVDEYNLAFGGNIANVVYWGMNFDIINFNYSMHALWNEQLENAYVDCNNPELNASSAEWKLSNIYKASGSGFNYQLGVILKPVQEFRLGFAFHTPTWYNLTETYYARLDYSYPEKTSYADTDNGYPASNYMNFRTPWRFIASAATVVGGRFILSADYEWANYGTMKYYVGNNDYDYGYDWWDSPFYKQSKGAFNDDPYYATNKDIKNYYKTSHTLRVGAELRVTPQFSLRAGYSFVSSPVKERAKDGKEVIYTAGTMPNYRFDNTTNYVTCGLGYRFQKFYVDLAYVYKHMNSEYHAYTSDPEHPDIPSPTAKLSLNNSQVVMSCGFKF